MKQLLFATSNQSKLKRFAKGLEEREIQLLSLSDVNVNVEVEEDGNTSIENALIKARAYSELVDVPVMAMDDNLYLEDIPEDKQPGTHVRRVNGKRLSDEEMIEYYSNLAKEFGKDGKITCRYVYGIAVINHGKEYTYTWNKEDFYLVDKPSDRINPGYPLNTISVNKKMNKYFTDVTEEDKALIHEDESHVVDFIEKALAD